jgi:photosystem II stability/assembly factor-like uncharacterized protein
VSRFRTRLPATSLPAALALVLAFASTALAAPPQPASTWIALAPLPERLDAPVLALAVSPADEQVVLAGTPGGAIYRSGDGGASWKLVRGGLGRGVTSIAFDPYRPGVVLAGTRGAGAWRSADGGQTWTVQPGLDRGTALSFGFAKALTAAGTDRGVYTAREGTAWKPAGLSQLSVDSLAVAAVNEPSRLVAGADATQGTEPLPLYGSGDGAGTWKELPGPPNSSLVSVLAAGPLPPGGDTRPLLLGTNAGAFLSTDNGASWRQLSGVPSLPSTDFNAAAFAGGRTDRFYLASDGGGSPSGGLWSTSDGGRGFASLDPPVRSVTALAVSGADQPLLYAATFRPADHAVMLWAYRDAGQPPKQPAAGVAPPAAPAAAPAALPQPRARARSWLAAALTGPEGPYLVAGAVALLVMLVAMVAYLRRGRV